MFPGMFIEKPDRKKALQELKSYGVMFVTYVAVIRVAPYVLHYLSKEKDELKLDF